MTPGGRPFGSDFMEVVVENHPASISALDQYEASFEWPQLAVGLCEVSRGPGVYFLRDGDGTILYIGKARCVAQRVLTHSRTRSFWDATFIPCSDEDAVILEAAWIQEVRPPENLMMLHADEQAIVDRWWWFHRHIPKTMRDRIVGLIPELAALE